MTDILQTICTTKRAEVHQRQATIPLSVLQGRAKDFGPVRGFSSALKNAKADARYGLIAEIKKASPSKGLIRENFDPPGLAQAYQAGGASCLSVLTDIDYFQGADAYLDAARRACNLPALRKDFMIDAYQITESRALGADCILLIMAVLDDAKAEAFRDLAGEWGMDVLVEVHSEQELERALRLKPEMIGINNRDLKTFEVDLGTTERLAVQVPANILVVSESGLGGPADLARMTQSGVTTFLIGESLMRENDVAAATRSLLQPETAAA